MHRVDGSQLESRVQPCQCYKCWQTGCFGTWLWLSLASPDILLWMFCYSPFLTFPSLFLSLLCNIYPDWWATQRRCRAATIFTTAFLLPKANGRGYMVLVCLFLRFFILSYFFLAWNDTPS